MTEITNQHEQLECAAIAAGYLGEYNDDTGEREWFGPGDGSDWNPRTNMDDAFMLVPILGLLVDVDNHAEQVQVVIGSEHNAGLSVMSELFTNHNGDKNAALMVAITRAAAEIGRCMA